MTARFTTGLVIGRFDPPHRGHSFLIAEAEKQTKKLAIIVCEYAGEAIPADLRATWMKEIFPSADVFVARNIITDGDHAAWADYVKKLLGYVPEAMFTSEGYGDLYASILGSKHILVDKDRTSMPISASMIRNDPSKYLEYLEPCVQEHFRSIIQG